MEENKQRSGTDESKSKAGSSKRSASSCKGQTLSFQPAFDDREELKRFLMGVVQKYTSLRASVLSSTPTATQIVSADGNSDNREEKNETAPTLKRSSPSLGLGNTDSASLCAPSSTAKEGTKPKRGRSSSKEWQGQKRSVEVGAASATVKNKKYRKLKSASGTGSSSFPIMDKDSRARIRRVKAAAAFNVHAPDPEETAPPNETDDDRRKRKERINGRRKRVKKFIEIEQLNHHVETLTQTNKTLVAENQVFRERLELAKQMTQKGLALSRELLCLPKTVAAASKDDDNSSTADRRKQLSQNARNNGSATDNNRISFSSANGNSTEGMPVVFSQHKTIPQVSRGAPSTTTSLPSHTVAASLHPSFTSYDPITMSSTRGRRLTQDRIERLPPGESLTGFLLTSGTLENIGLIPNRTLRDADISLLTDILSHQRHLVPSATANVSDDCPFRRQDRNARRLYVSLPASNSTAPRSEGGRQDPRRQPP